MALGCTPTQHLLEVHFRCCTKSTSRLLRHMCAAGLDMAQHSGQRIGYARVVEHDQNLARQIATLDQLHRLVEEKQSSARRDGRTALAEMIACSRAGDTVVVSSMDRLARSVVDLNQIVGELVAKGVVVEFIAERSRAAPVPPTPSRSSNSTSWPPSPSSNAPSPRNGKPRASAPRRPAVSTPAEPASARPRN